MNQPDARGVLDTRTFIDIDEIDQDLLPDIPEITAVTMAELHQGISAAKTPAAGTARLERLSMAVERFEPLPFESEAASRYGTLATLLASQGRSLKQRKPDMMIAAIASVHRLPLYTRYPSDFKDLDSVLRVVAI